jgi:TetR/AcrR family fatty acid metabolism transcriptional regulator
MAAKRNGEGDKREQILRAAATVFASKGFFGARVSEIAAKAKVADGTIYLYFKSKEEILAALFALAMTQFLDRARLELATLEGAEARLERLARFHLEQVGSNRDLAIVFQVELRHSQKFMERVSTTILADYLKLIQQVISDGQSQGVWRKELPASTMAKCFFGMLDEMATNWVLSHRQYPLGDLAPVVSDLFIGGLRAK